MKISTGDTVDVLFYDYKTDKTSTRKCKVVSPSVPDIDRTPVAQIEHHGAILNISWNGEAWAYSPEHEYC